MLVESYQDKKNTRLRPHIYELQEYFINYYPIKIT